MDDVLRKSWMGLLARAPDAALERLWGDLNLDVEHMFLRSPEQGAVMVRGRTGARGAPFNLGEMTVTRCALRLTDGRVGHGYVQGRNKRKSTISALVDALMQGDEAPTVEAKVLTPLREIVAQKRATKTAKADATKVTFFTMARGED
jgi:alpha-D-ribose 1-methylphosphonate 5-triphosphate synthase subunit PhnG